jgi:DNA-binding MarR family transcriptional regulator
MEIDQYLRQSPIYLFNEIHQILFRDVKLLLKEKGVNFLQALIIVTLFLERRKKKDFRKKISPGDIFKALKVSKGGMSQNLSFLEEKGWLKRVLDQEDARSFSLELTELGELRALELMQIMELKEKNIETKMGKTHLDELVEILERFKKEYFPTHP